MWWRCTFTLLLGCGSASNQDAGTDAAVPPDRWANAVVDSDVAAEITDMGTTYTNIAADPTVIVGEPDGLSGSVALGDTGHYVVVDLGASEEAFDGPGDDLEVREYDLFAGGAPEAYAVSVANDPAGPFTALGDAIGSQGFDLEGTGLTSVRYVRVQSTLSVDDIVNGLGSPEYPGAEIDAIGAFYPGSLPVR